MLPQAQPFIIFLILFLVLPSYGSGETVEVRDALVRFMSNLSPGNVSRPGNWGWDLGTDPCSGGWRGVECYTDGKTVKKIVLEGLNMTGELDAASLCMTKALLVFSVNGNNVSGALPEEISNCSRLTHLYLNGNRFSGILPRSLARMGNLRRIVVSDNDFSGDIPDLSRISGLLSFLAENNRLSGSIPSFDFSNLDDFNVSNNGLSGAIPDVRGKFKESSFLGNPELCGSPLPNSCPPPLPPPPALPSPLPSPQAKGKGTSKKDYFIYSGYGLIGLIVVFLIALKLMKKRKDNKEKALAKNRVLPDGSQDKVSTTSSGSKANISEFSITSTEETGRGSSSLVILSNRVVNELKFEDLLRSPAELMGRNRNGTLYKVILNDQVTLVVKRTRDWDISSDDFKKRMLRIDQVRHPNVLPIVAFYCSRHERLVVYEFQENGSLSKLLQGSQNGEPFDWNSRLNVATKISMALAFMHDGLETDKIAHGNLKSSNIVFGMDMEPLTSEYGLAEIDNQDQSFPDTFKADVFNFGIILLELLTGKLVESNGSELAKWVNSAIREEWTVEVFDSSLVSGGTSEEKMVGLLRVALKCIDGSQGMKEVARMVKSIEEIEEQSITSDP